MRRLLLIGFCSALLVSAQRRTLSTVNAETPEGQLLQQIGQENDVAKKTALMDEFLQKHPKHDGAPWVLDQMVVASLKAGNFDKALDAGQKLLAGDPDDVVTSHNCLKAAEGKKDPDLIKQWAGATSKAARKAAAAPEPAAEDQKENWKNNVDYSKQVDKYTEYSLYATMLATTDPAKKIMLAEALEAQNPKSEYVPQLQDQVFLALRQTGQNDKATDLAEKVIATNQTNEDMLLVVADRYLNQKKEPEKVIALSNKLVEVMNAKPKPEGVSDADWTKRKNMMMGLGHWMAGITHANANRLKETDTSLRAALPLIQDNPQLAAPALFHLGLVNYKMGSASKNKTVLADALAFSRKCAAIKSAYAGQAAKNAAAIQQQFGLK